jgi:hypothetical protein
MSQVRSLSAAMEYMRALGPDVRTNCWRLGEQVLAYGPEDEIGPGLAVDETTHPKREKTPRASLPSTRGSPGGVENCVTWMFSALVTATGQAWAWSGLYMPKEPWAENPARRK